MTALRVVHCSQVGSGSVGGLNHTKLCGRSENMKIGWWYLVGLRLSCHQNPSLEWVYSDSVHVSRILSLASGEWGTALLTCTVPWQCTIQSGNKCVSFRKLDIHTPWLFTDSYIGWMSAIIISHQMRLNPEGKEVRDAFQPPVLQRQIWPDMVRMVFRPRCRPLSCCMRSLSIWPLER